MGHQFAAATAVTRADGGPRGGITYAAEVHDGWDIGGVANGGYLLAIAGRAIADLTGRPPMTVTAHYLNPGLPGPAEVVVEPVKAGKRLATVTASLRRGETELIRVLATCGEVADDGARLVDGAPPDLPPYEACVADDSTSDPDAPPALGLAMPTPGLMERLGLRLRPGDDAFRFGRTTGRAEIAGWFAFRDEQPIDAVALLLVADSFAPPIFNAGIGPELGADGRADGARPGDAGAGSAALPLRLPVRGRRPALRGRRDLGLGRHPRRRVPPTGPDPAHLTRRISGGRSGCRRRSRRRPRRRSRPRSRCAG